MTDSYADIGTSRGTFMFLLALIPRDAHFPAATLPNGFGSTSGGSHEHLHSRPPARVRFVCAPARSRGADPGVRATGHAGGVLHLQRPVDGRERRAVRHAWHQLSVHLV